MTPLIPLKNTPPKKLSSCTFRRERRGGEVNIERITFIVERRRDSGRSIVPRVETIWRRIGGSRERRRERTGDDRRELLS